VQDRGETAEIALPAPRRRHWGPAALAASLALALALGLAASFVPWQGSDRPAWVVQARASHEGWNMDEDRPGAAPVAGGVVLAALGQLGNAEWTGVRYADLLATVGVKDSVIYTAHYGMDGHLSGDPNKLPISRGVSIAKAMDITIDFGATWIEANLLAPPNPYSWQRWTAQIAFPEKGYYEIWARATDDAGEMQTFAINRNPKGYLNNTMHRIAVRVAA
jgi:hypothetical protein